MRSKAAWAFLLAVVGVAVYAANVLATPAGGFTGTTIAKATYGEIVKPERISWTQSFSDKDGGTTTHPMAPTWPKEMRTTVLFEAQGPKKTKITVQWLPADGSSDAELKTFEDGRAGMNQGWSGTFEQLNEFLAKG